MPLSIKIIVLLDLSSSSERNKMNHQQLYKDMGIDLKSLGCIMLGTDPIKVNDIISESDLYFSTNPDMFWIKGIVSEDVPHVTLLYGLMESGQTWKEYVDTVLDGWGMKQVQIDKVIAFESTWESEPYHCLVAELVITPKLLDANARLRMLPHIDTFPVYRAHITLAYIKEDVKKRNAYLEELNTKIAGRKIKTKEINYGGSH